MKLSHVLPLAALATAYVIPDEQVMSQVSIESNRPPMSLFASLPSKDELIHEFENSFSHIVENSRNALDEAVELASSVVENTFQTFDKSNCDTNAWLSSEFDPADEHRELGEHGGRGRHGRHGRHGGSHKAPNLTVYQLISESKYTTKLAELINEYDDLVQLLNGTAANYTIFAPIDKAFEKIPEGAPKPSKELLKKVLTYHVSSDFYPAGRVLVSHTIPTLLSGERLGGNPQRLSTNIGLKGLTVNFYSRIIAIDIFGTNGVIHGVDSLLLPPPKAAQIIDLLPGEFSTLELGLLKTGLLDAINDTDTHTGGTLFAPSNFAFQKLGPRINGFLFSRYGQKYLKALLQYHVVANQTLYSDAFYKAESVEETNIPKGLFHIDLPTLLEDRSLSIDVARFGRYINIKINGFGGVAIQDGIASDGVIHVVSSVLIPPKQVGGVTQQWEGEELSEEDLQARLEPFIDDIEEL